MAEPSPRGANTVTLALVAWIIAFTVLLIQQWWFVKSGFLYRDDTVIIPLTFEFGHVRLNEFPFLWYVCVLDLLGSLPIDSELALALFKVVVLALFACVPGLLAGLFFLIGGVPWLSVCTALVIAGYPLAVDQGATYLAAAHPTYGTMVAIGALAMFWLSWRAPTRKFVAGVVVAAGLAYLASLASPTLRLMVVVPVLWIMVMSIVDWRGWKRSAIALAIVVLPLALRVTHLMEHHYDQIPGRVDIAIPTILGNAFKGVQMTLAPLLGPGGRMVFLLYLVAFALIVVALYIGSHCRPMRKENHVRRHVWSGSEMTVFLGLCILTAAIAFGPPSVLTVFRPRYVVPSFLLIALGVGAIFVWSMSRQGAAVTRLAGVALALLVVANVIRTDALQERQLGAAKLTHEAAKKLIAKEKHRWGERSQIALLTTRPQRTPTGGSVQRSNWYLRHLADHEIEVGLVGRVDMLGSDPFVKSSLKLSDLKMTGLREDLSLYLYEADKSGRRFLPRDVLFLGNDPAQMKFARFGAAPAKLAPADLSWGSCKEKKRDIFVWPTAPDVLAKHGAKPCVRK